MVIRHWGKLSAHFGCSRCFTPRMRQTLGGPTNAAWAVGEQSDSGAETGVVRSVVSARPALWLALSPVRAKESWTSTCTSRRRYTC